MPAEQTELYRQLSEISRDVVPADPNALVQAVQEQPERPSYEIADKDEDDGLIDSSNRFKELDL